MADEVIPVPIRKGPHAAKITVPLKLSLGIGILGLILGQAMIYNHAAPFAWVFLVLVWYRWRKFYGPALLGAMAGMLSGVSWQAALLLFGWSFLIPVPWRQGRLDWMLWPILALGSLSQYLIGQNLTIFALILGLMISAGSLVLYWAANREIQRMGSGLGDQGTLILALASFGALIAGLEGFALGPVKPGLFLGGLMILTAAGLAGAPGGAVAGATLGVTLAVREAGPTGGMGILVAGGFLAGWLTTRHWRFASLGLSLGIVLYAILIQVPHQLTTFWISLIGAAVFFQAVPDSYMAMAQSWAEALITGESPDTLPNRLERIAHVMKEMARAFRIEEEPRNAEANLVEVVVDGVCRRCSLHRSCWEDEFYRSYRGLLDLTAKAETEIVTPDDLKGDLKRRCIRPDAIAHATNLAMNKERERANLALRVKESRDLAEMQLLGLSELVKDMAREWERDREPTRSLRRQAHLDYRVGVAKRPRRGGMVTGDSDLVRELPGHRVVFGLSDGMGVGPRAAWESGTALSLLEQLLMAGFSQMLAVRAVNTTLLLRSVDDHFATLDLVLVDREGRGAELVKVAAVPTFLRRNGRVETIESQSLPVGILQEVRIDPIYHTLEPGDLIVMVTDGVLENGDPEAEAKLSQFLEEAPAVDPAMMAETLLSYMLGHSENGRDDAAVMVIQIMASGQAVKKVSGLSGPGVMEWHRLTPTPIRRRRARG